MKFLATRVQISHWRSVFILPNIMKFFLPYILFLFRVIFLYSPPLLLHNASGGVPKIQCHDPDVSQTTHNKDRKFLVIGSEGSEGAGLGNLLIFFPSAFWFAAFTGRNIVISDGSTIGEMCRIITCGFPFVSEMERAFPKILTKAALAHVEDVKASDFRHYIEGTKDVSANVVRAFGYQAMSDWWVYFNTTVHCVKKITGCDLGDIPCGDRHAYQRLIRGPFKTALSEKEEKRIFGVPDHIKHAVLTLPHSYAPRFDAAIHIRAQFHHFELQSDLNNPEYRKEVRDWLNSSECKTVFQSLEEKLIAEIKESRKGTPAVLAAEASIANANLNINNKTTNNNTTSTSSPQGVNANASLAMSRDAAVGAAIEEDDPIYVYLAADNEEVKDSFAAILEQHHDHHLRIHVMRVESRGIHHVKNLAKMKKLSDNEGLLDLVFDWYALTLANSVFAWRKGGTNMVSTFVHSAQRVSGTIERTSLSAPTGQGIGTKGYQLIRNKRGHYYFDNMWIYNFLEDYQNP